MTTVLFIVSEDDGNETHYRVPSKFIPILEQLNGADIRFYGNGIFRKGHDKPLNSELAKFISKFRYGRHINDFSNVAEKIKTYGHTMDWNSTTNKYKIIAHVENWDSISMKYKPVEYIGEWVNSEDLNVRSKFSGYNEALICPENSYEVFLGH